MVTFSQCHRFIGHSLYDCSLVTQQEVAQTLAMVDYVKESTAKKSCKNSEYGSF